MDIEKVSGIYKIENLINGKVYVGQTNNLYKRKLEHFAALRRGNHCNKHLQFAFNKYGEENFEFKVIEMCPESILPDKEIYWIHYLNSFDNGYNLTMGGEGAYGTGKEIILLNTNEFFESIKSASDKYGISPTGISNCCSHNTNYSGLTDEGIPMIWMHLTEYKEKSSEDIANIINNAPNLLKREVKVFNKKVILLNTGEIFNSPIAASKLYNISASAIGQCCRSEIKCAGKNANGDRLFWMYLNEYNLLDSSQRVEINVQIENKTYKKINTTGQKVVLLNTGEVFESMTNAANKYETNVNGIKQSCDQSFTFSGKDSTTGEKYVWVYYDDYISMTRDNIRKLLYKAYDSPYRNHEARMRKVVLLNTGEIFESAKAAAHAYNISYPSRITGCCRRPEDGYVGKNSNGEKLYWRYYDDVSGLTQSELKQLLLDTSTAKRSHKRSIILLNKLEVFDAIKDAAEKYGLNAPNIINSCKTGKASGKDSDTGEYFHWMYYDEYLKVNPNNGEIIA